jgi:hypothetical protein
MNEAARLQIAKDLFEAFMKGDMGPIFAAVADDVTVRLTIPDGTPLSGEFKGKEGLGEYFSRVADTVETTAFEILNYLAGGDQVAVVGRESMTVKRSGAEKKDSDWVMVCTFTGDKISKILVVEELTVIVDAYRS